MKRKILMFWCAGLLGAVPLAMAQAPVPPVVVPSLSELASDDANSSSRTDLEQRHAVLLKRYQDWKARADAFNRNFVGREFDAESPEAKHGAAEQAWLTQESEAYEHDSKQFKDDVGRLRLKQTASVREHERDAENARVIDGLNALAQRLRWSPEKRARLAADLNKLGFDGDPGVTSALIRRTWLRVMIQSQDPDLAREASQGDGAGFPGAGTQSFNDCAVYALANAAGLPYGVVATRAAELIRQGDWRDTEERADPRTAIEQKGLKGGEVVMLAESFGQADVVSSADFARTVKAGRPVMANVVPADGNVKRGHEVVLSRTFQHSGETWFEMMDSNQPPQRRLFLSSKELNTMLQENGIAYQPEPGTTPTLLRKERRP